MLCQLKIFAKSRRHLKTTFKTPLHSFLTCYPICLQLEYLLILRLIKPFVLMASKGIGAIKLLLLVSNWTLNRGVADSNYVPAVSNPARIRPLHVVPIN